MSSEDREIQPLLKVTHHYNFYRFPDLPGEIRNQIWEHAITLQEPRVVEIRTRTFDGEWDWCARYTPEVVPGLHLACRESREIALPEYHTLFGSRVLFNPAFDTLYLPRDTWSMEGVGILRLLKADPRLAELRHLAADFNPWFYHGHQMRFDIKPFLRLELISLVLPKRSQVTETIARQFQSFEKVFNKRRTQKILTVKNGESVEASSPRRCKLVKRVQGKGLEVIESEGLFGESISTGQNS